MSQQERTGKVFSIFSGYKPAYIYSTEEEIRAHTRPLDICPLCKYVRCSCGNCHSEDCRETCLYTSGQEAS